MGEPIVDIVTLTSPDEETTEAPPPVVVDVADALAET